MTDVGVKMGVSGISQFKQQISEAQSTVKTYDSALKLAEKQLKATGDAETYLQSKTTALQGKLQAQQSAVKSAEAALKSMADSGVDKASAAYQKMEKSLLDAQAAVLDTQMDIQNIGTESTNAAGKTERLASSLGGLNRTVSLETVISGLGRITDTMERGIQKAGELGEAIWGNIMNSAQWADDSATMALMYGVDLDTFLRVQKLVANGMDTSVEAILKSQQKLAKNVGNGSGSFLQTMKELGLAYETVGKFGDTSIMLATNDPTEMFWKAGEAIMALGDSFEQESKAQEVFGKSWRELIPLFTDYKTQEAFDKALEGVTVNSEKEVSDLAALNDKVAELQGNIDTLTNKGWAALAPSLTGAADALSGLLGNVLEYLDTPEGKEALNEMSESISGLFEDLEHIDPDSVVKNFQTVFDKIVGGFRWIKENKDGVVNGIKVIAGAFGLLKVSEGVLTFLQLINGARGALGGGGGATEAAAGAAGATARGGIFSKAFSFLKTPFGKFASAEALIAYIGSEMIKANMNDENLNAIYGDGTGGSVVDTMSEEAVKAAKKYWQVYEETGTEAAMDARDRLQKTLQDEGFYNDEQGVSLIENIFDNWLNGMDPDGLGERLKARFQDGRKKPMDLSEAWKTFTDGKSIEVPTEPEAPENAAEILRAQIGTVPVAVQPMFSGAGYGGSTGGGSADLLTDIGYGGFSRLWREHANGIPYVPWDGYAAILHKGERVVPAREVSSRSYSSNMYFENVNINNGMDAEALAAKIAEANRATMSGTGN